jgi:hypothetical protein
MDKKNKYSKSVTHIKNPLELHCDFLTAWPHEGYESTHCTRLALVYCCRIQHKSSHSTSEMVPYTTDWEQDAAISLEMLLSCKNVGSHANSITITGVFVD